MSNQKITALPVERDEMGYWTHPNYFEPGDSREFGFPGEFEAWLDANNLEYQVISLECDHTVSDELTDHILEECDGDVSEWNPGKPEGDGWFIGSIHDTEDGPYCIWLRDKGSESVTTPTSTRGLI